MSLFYFTYICVGTGFLIELMENKKEGLWVIITVVLLSAFWPISAGILLGNRIANINRK